LALDISFPFRIDGRGRVARADEDTHVRHLIEQLLFTSPGERVNRPDFGTGLMQLVFSPSGPELAAAVEFTVKGALQRWLADRIQVEALDVQADDATLRVTVSYIVRRTQERREARFERAV
jgi:uncharacterized protein